MREPNYDVVLCGASGFVGQQTVEYFAKHTQPNEVRWAIAGRDRHKLELVKSQVGIDVDILVGDSQDSTAIDIAIESNFLTYWLKLHFGALGQGL